MSAFILITLIVLVFAIIYQIAKASELTTILRGEEKVKKQTNRLMAILLVAFFLIGLWGLWYCHDYLMDFMLPVSASDHGVAYDSMFLTTTIITGIVFLITQALLFWFCWKYQASDERKATFFAHNNKLELVWTTIPAIVMAILVAVGLKHWFTMTAPAPPDSQVVEIVGKQFNWLVRYPGQDGVLGNRDYKLINEATNVLGLDWHDAKNQDDIISENGEMHLIVNKPVRLIIGSRDVIHNVGLAHFRMKMDAVPGIVTTMWFTPTVTTAEMKKITGNDNFVYEISCDQMCGKGHYSMRGTVVVETQKEYDAYMAQQKSYYAMQHETEVEAPAADSSSTTEPVVTLN